MDLTRAVLCGLALLLGCGAAPRAPADAVRDYFRFLARDPIRTLPLLTPAFHVQHGLHAVTNAEASGHPKGETTAAWGLDRLELGWLAVQSREPYRVLSDRLSVTLVDVQQSGDRAVVTARIQAAGRPFEQRFELVREGPAGPWRIDAVEQAGVLPDSRLAAFVAHPTESERRRLEQLSRGGG